MIHWDRNISAKYHCQFYLFCFKWRRDMTYNYSSSDTSSIFLAQDLSFEVFLSDLGKLDRFCLSDPVSDNFRGVLPLGGIFRESRCDGDMDLFMFLRDWDESGPRLLLLPVTAYALLRFLRPWVDGVFDWSSTLSADIRHALLLFFLILRSIAISLDFKSTSAVPGLETCPELDFRVDFPEKIFQTNII